MSSSESVTDTTSTTTRTSADNGEWLLTVTSPTLKRWAWGGALVVLLVHIFMAVVSAIGDTGVAVTVVDQLSFLGLGLIFSSCILCLLRPRVRVNEAGVEVRNIFGAQFYRWSIIHGLSFPRNARWARLELPDFEFVPMMAFQLADKATIARKVENFRVLEDRYMPAE